MHIQMLNIQTCIQMHLHVLTSQNRDAQKSLSEQGTTEDVWWKCVASDTLIVIQ